MGELFGTREVADLFGVDRTTVVLWAKWGWLPALRTPGGHLRFRADEIRQLAAKNLPRTEGPPR